MEFSVILYSLLLWLLFSVGFESTVEKRDFYHELTMKNIHNFEIRNLYEMNERKQQTNERKKKENTLTRMCV